MEKKKKQETSYFEVELSNDFETQRHICFYNYFRLQMYSQN